MLGRLDASDSDSRDRERTRPSRGMLAPLPRTRCRQTRTPRCRRLRRGPCRDGPRRDRPDARQRCREVVEDIQRDGDLSRVVLAVDQARADRSRAGSTAVAATLPEFERRHSDHEPSEPAAQDRPDAQSDRLAFALRRPRGMPNRVNDRHNSEQSRNYREQDRRPNADDLIKPSASSGPPIAPRLSIARSKPYARP